MQRQLQFKESKSDFETIIFKEENYIVLLSYLARASSLLTSEQSGIKKAWLAFQLR